MSIYQLFLRKMAPAGALSVLTYFVFDKWHNLFLGALILFFYFLFVSSKTQVVLVSYFSFAKSLRIRLLVAFLGLATLGWFLGIFIFFNYFNGLAVFLSFFLNALVWSLVKVVDDYKDDKEDDKEIIDEAPNSKIIPFIYIGMVIYGFYLLIESKTGGVVSSPWQTINPNYVWVFLLSTFLLAAMILFSRTPLKILLFFVVVQSFLLHSYLPLTHDLFYGADGWRHIANEQRLVEGKGFKEAELSVDKSEIRNPKSETNFKLQNLKTKAGLLSYANFWGTNAVLAKMTGVSLISLTKWFLPIVWSIIFTILLYEIGLTLGWGGKKSLLLAWAGMLPFALQAGGSFSLPVNFGFLIFILFFLLLLKRMQNPSKGQRNILLALGVGSALGYLLFFVLYWLSWGVMAAVKSGRKLVIIQGIILAPLVLPALELAGKFSVLDIWVNFLEQAKQFVGNLSAYYLASGPRPHDISGGNILFNQIPSFAFTSNVLTERLWWLPVFVLAAVGFIVLGIIKNRKDLIYKFILAIFSILLTSYFLSFYLLSGERLLSRRLDATLAFLFLILLFYGIIPLLPRGGDGGVAGVSGRVKYPIINYCLIFILSLAITASYTLGPDTFTVSSNQFTAAKYVWSQEKDSGTHCVVGGTYPLLALEAVSDKEIIGGGFPIDASFGQPKREELYKQMNIAINNNVLSMSRFFTQSDHCWFIGDRDNFQKQGILNVGDFKIFGDVAAVRYNTKY